MAAIAVVASSCAQPLPTVTIVNPFEFDVYQTRGFVDESWQRAVQKRADNQAEIFGVGATMEDSVASGTGVAGPPGSNCVGELVVWHFLRAVDTSGWELSAGGPSISSGYSPDDFELIHTLGPGFCFEDRTGSDYVIGNDPWMTTTQG